MYFKICCEERHSPRSQKDREYMEERLFAFIQPLSTWSRMSFGVSCCVYKVFIAGTPSKGGSKPW